MISNISREKRVHCIRYSNVLLSKTLRPSVSHNSHLRHKSTATRLKKDAKHLQSDNMKTTTMKMASDIMVLTGTIKMVIIVMLGRFEKCEAGVSGNSRLPYKFVGISHEFIR